MTDEKMLAEIERRHTIFRQWFPLSLLGIDTVEKFDGWLEGVIEDIHRPDERAYGIPYWITD